MGMNKLVTATASLCLMMTAGAVLSAPLPPTAPGTSEKWGTIKGHVRDTKGNPIAQAQVVIVETGETTSTDKNGTYVFTGEDAALNVITASSAKHQAETLTITVRPGTIQTRDLVLVDASHTSAPLAKGKKAPTAIIEVITSQGHHVPPPDPIANGPLDPFQGDLGLHSTARSR